MKVDYLSIVTDLIPLFFHDLSSSITGGEQTGWDLLLGGLSRYLLHFYSYIMTAHQEEVPSSAIIGDILSCGNVGLKGT
jgi:hypothetical protein